MCRTLYDVNNIKRITPVCTILWECSIFIPRFLHKENPHKSTTNQTYCDNGLLDHLQNSLPPQFLHSRGLWWNLGKKQIYSIYKSSINLYFFIYYNNNYPWQLTNRNNSNNNKKKRKKGPLELCKRARDPMQGATP